MKRLIILLLIIQKTLSSFDYKVQPYGSFGTHINSCGLQGELTFTKKHHWFKANSSSSLTLYTLGAGSISSLGIPGQSLELNSGLNLSFTYGIYSLNYYLSYYITSDKTNQAYGSLMYKIDTGNWEVGLDLGNDDMYFLATDKFRTTKGSIFYRNYTQENLYGISLNFFLWTGDLDGKVLGDESAEARDRYYSMDGYGGDISHGILALALRINDFELSIGWDSEIIRDSIQNRWHYFYNRPEVPMVDRENRFYIQTTFYPKKFGY